MSGTTQEVLHHRHRPIVQVLNTLTVYRKTGSHFFTDGLRLMGQQLAKRREKVTENAEGSLNVYSCSSVSPMRTGGD